MIEQLITTTLILGIITGFITAAIFKRLMLLIQKNIDKRNARKNLYLRETLSEEAYDLVKEYEDLE